jgi:hypothetical protein
MALLVTTIKMLPTFCDLDLWAGDSVTFDVTVTDEGAPADLSVGTLAAELEDGTQFDIDIAGNVVTLSMAEGTTKARPDPFQWDLEWAGGPHGTVTLVAGRMRVREDVT